MSLQPEMSPLRFAASLGVLLVVTLADASAQTTAPRLRESRLPAQMPYAVGGGEVMLELLVDASGAVSRVEPLRVTPPYTEQLIDAATTWKFDVARAPADKRTAAVAPVLVVAVIRPPASYSGPSLGTPPQTLNRPSSLLPQVAAVTTPPYPPLALGSGMVLVELEMNRRAELRGYRVVSPPSGFDNAALDAVRSWRFVAPDAPDTPERFFVYAVLGFREPVGPTRRPLR
jgi:outer membrane biosynthesis protein TonB